MFAFLINPLGLFCGDKKRQAPLDLKILAVSAVWDDHHATKVVALGSALQLQVVKMRGTDILQMLVKPLSALQKDQALRQSPRYKPGLVGTIWKWPLSSL